MDAVWLILDSLSYNATPFAPGGPDTMPQFERLAEHNGIIYHEAYAPGPLSPSSHASFFTGALPSTHGMHEANPFFDGQLPTIADRLRDTHQTHLISVNNFLFTGLEHGFDETENFTNTYQLFEDATDPREFARSADYESKLARYYAFATQGSKPLRSILNGLNYKLQTTIGGQEFLEDIPKRLGDDAEHYQYAHTINDEIRRALKTNEPCFVVANYMDIHPPLSPSDDAISAIVSDIDKIDLPVGKPTERTTPNMEKSYDVDAMHTLYLAGIWDVDRKVTPLIQELINNEAFVIVTADHGATFRNTPLSTERRHVPLVLFHPDTEPDSSRRTVDLRTMYHTTIDEVGEEAIPDDYPSLFAMNGEYEVAITEAIYHGRGKEEEGVLLNFDETVPDELHHDIAIKKAGAELRLAAGSEQTSGPKSAVNELRQIGKQLRNRDVATRKRVGNSYDQIMEKRLEDLGYM